MSDGREKGFVDRAYEAVSSAVGSAANGVKEYFEKRGRAKKDKQAEKEPIREKRKVIDEAKEKRIKEKLPEVREAMEYALKEQKGRTRKDWVKRRFLPGAAAAVIAFGAHEKYIHEPMKNVAEVVLYTADATQRLARAAKRLGEEIVGRGAEGARFEIAQKEFEVADMEYFGGIRELMDVYKQNLQDRKHVVDEMKNAAEGFGKVARKAPGYESFRETGVPGMREKVNKWMSEFIGGQSKEDAENRMSKEYADNYNELLKMLNEADRVKHVGKKEVQEIAERLAKASQGLEKLNKDDEKDLAKKMEEVNNLYALGRKMRELETGQIRKKDAAYTELTALGRKYGLNTDGPENYANIIAYAAGVLLAGMAYKFGSGLGNKVLPRAGPMDTKNISRKYLEGKIAKEESGKAGAGAGDLENKVISVLIVLSPLFLLPFILRMTGFAIAGGTLDTSSTLVNSFLFVWLFLLFFMFARKIYKRGKT